MRWDGSWVPMHRRLHRPPATRHVIKARGGGHRRLTPHVPGTPASARRTGGPFEFENGCCFFCVSPSPGIRRMKQPHSPWRMKSTRSGCIGGHRRQVSFAGRPATSARRLPCSMTRSEQLFSEATSHVSTSLGCGELFKLQSSSSKEQRPSPPRLSGETYGQVCRDEHNPPQLTATEQVSFSEVRRSQLLCGQVAPP